MTGSAKNSAMQWVVRFFEGLNFTNEQHSRNSWNLRTSKKNQLYGSRQSHLLAGMKIAKKQIPGQ